MSTPFSAHWGEQLAATLRQVLFMDLGEIPNLSLVTAPPLPSGAQPDATPDSSYDVPLYTHARRPHADRLALLHERSWNRVCLCAPARSVYWKAVRTGAGTKRAKTKRKPGMRPPRRKYPRLVVHAPDAAVPAEFAQRVEMELSALEADDYRAFLPWQRVYLELLHELGFESGTRRFLTLLKCGSVRVPQADIHGIKNPAGYVRPSQTTAFQQLFSELDYFVGNHVLDRLGDAASKWTPFCYPEISPAGPGRKELHVGWCSMPRADADSFLTRRYDASSYVDDAPRPFPPAELGPVEIDLGGSTYPLSYRNHAVLDQLEKRIFPFIGRYGHLRNAFHFLNGLTGRFVPVTLPAGNQALAVYKQASVGTLELAVCSEIVGQDIILAGATTADEVVRSHAYLLVGYCPVYVDGGRLVALTVLLPWFKKTPLGDHLAKHPDVPADVRSLVDEMQEDEQVTRIFRNTNEIKVLSYLHSCGYKVVILPDGSSPPSK